ncbi:hypothetical protein [Streptomyces sp. P9(2023)]|uniref:hypothetical protein n=1 Tax=Streptomyces sp. P9(2023) TaxID=3064394 RepID=UPI0037DC156A
MKHTRRFTVIGNHLAQHQELSLLAIGLSTHIQSLPDGADISIRALAERFPEGEIRIAAGLRELETHGYLARTLERLAGGRMATRTVSYNRPGATKPDGHSDPEGPVPEPDREGSPPSRTRSRPPKPSLPEGPATDLA